MAEILPIAATAFTIAKLCGELAAYIGGIQNSDKVVDQVYREIKDLEVVLLEIQKSVDRHGSERIKDLTIEGHWLKLHQAMDDCEETLKSMRHIMSSVRRSVVKRVFRKTGQKVMLDWNSEEITVLRRDIDSHRTVISFSLQMITMYCYPRCSN
jgi:hypothetical protein